MKLLSTHLVACALAAGCYGEHNAEAPEAEVPIVQGRQPTPSQPDSVSGRPAPSSRQQPADSQIHATAAPPPLEQFVTLDLYSLAIDETGEPERLNATLAPREDVHFYEISPDSQWAIYTVADDEAQQYRLYSCQIDGSGQPIPLGGIYWQEYFTISPDSRRAVWLRDDNVLVGGLLDGVGNLVTLDHQENRRFFFWLSKDSTQVVYLHSGDLYRCMMTGAEKPVKLNGPWSGNHGVDIFSVSPDGRWVVYRMQGSRGSGTNLYSRPIDGSGRPIRLNRSGNTDGTQILISSDGQRVVYYAQGDDATTLYSTLIDGSQPPVNLNGSNEDAHFPYSHACKISPDGKHVVFYSYKTRAIHSRAIDGHGELIRLSGEADSRFAVSPDGTRVVYLESKQIKGFAHHDLRSRLIDGGEPAATLYAISKFGGHVWVRFQVSPDSCHVIFRARTDSDGPYALFRNAIDGTERPLRLSGPLGKSGGISGFKVTPDGKQVVYLEGQGEGDPLHIFARPLDGNAPPRRLSQPLNEGGGVCKFKISPDSRRVLYLAYRSTEQLRKQLASSWKRAGSGPGVHLPQRDKPYIGVP